MLSNFTQIQNVYGQKMVFELTNPKDRGKMGGRHATYQSWVDAIDLHRIMDPELRPRNLLNLPAD